MDAIDGKLDAEIEETTEKMDARDEKIKEKMEMMNAKIDKQKDDIITSLTEKFQMEVETNKSEITGIKEQMNDIERNLKVMQNLVGENYRR